MARTLLAGGYLQFFLGDHDLCRDLVRKAESHALAAGDLEAEGWALELGAMADSSNRALHESTEKRLRRALRLFEEVALPIGIFSVSNAMGELYRMRNEYESALGEYKRCITIAEENGFSTAASVYANIGECQRHLGHISRAKESFRHSLKVALEEDLGNRAITWGLDKLASIAEDPARAARLIGASDAIRDDIGTGIAPADQADYYEALELIRSRLSESEFERHYADGRAMSIAEAAREALQI
jgi:tetratricopeptide (TPR) repeat protein